MLTLQCQFIHPVCILLNFIMFRLLIYLFVINFNEQYEMSHYENVEFYVIAGLLNDA